MPQLNQPNLGVSETLAVTLLRYIGHTTKGIRSFTIRDNFAVAAFHLHYLLQVCFMNGAKVTLNLTGTSQGNVDLPETVVGLTELISGFVFSLFPHKKAHPHIFYQLHPREQRLDASTFQSNSLLQKSLDIFSLLHTARYIPSPQLEPRATQTRAPV